MNNFLKNNRLYFKIIIVVIISYISIKLIDNLSNVISVFHSISTILSPFILAFIIAYILNPIVNLFNKKFKISRGISILLTYLLFIILLGLAITYIFPRLCTSLIDLIDSIPEFTSYIQHLYVEVISKLKIPKEMNSYIPFNTDSGKIISSIGFMISSLSNWLLNTAISLTSSLINWVFGFLISIYVLIDKDKFIKISGKLIRIIFGRKFGDGLIGFVKILNDKIGTYIGIKALDSLIIGILAFVGLTLIKSDYVLLLSVVVGITNMIPYFGPFIGMIVGFFINLFLSPMKAVFVLIYLFLLQQFDAWYLDPKLIGNKVGLSPFLVILGVTIGGAIYGPIGMILGSPVMSVIKIYLTKLIKKYEYRAQ